LTLSAYLKYIYQKRISETYFFGDASVRRMLALGYLHAIFPLRVRPHLARHELLPHATSGEKQQTPVT
jgi:hypothetical protein